MHVEVAHGLSVTTGLRHSGLVEGRRFDQAALDPTVPPVYELLVVDVLVLGVYVVGLLHPV